MKTLFAPPVYSDKIIEGSSKTSLTTVIVLPYPPTSAKFGLRKIRL